jgi:hypothetical protein
MAYALYRLDLDLREFGDKVAWIESPPHPRIDYCFFYTVISRPLMQDMY